MPFPQKTKFLKRPIGWENLGKIGFNFKFREPSYITHNFCKTILKIGKENGELFKFCPRCMVKIN